MIERRRSVRKDIELPIRIHGLGDKALGDRTEALSVNLSDDGIAFHSPVTMNQGQMVDIEIKMPNATNYEKRRIKVLRCQEKSPGNFLIGAMFVPILSDHLNADDFYADATNLEKLLANMVESETSDLHMTVGYAPAIRVQKKIHFIGPNKIKSGDIEALFFPLLSQDQIDYFKSNKDLNFCFTSKNDQRFRVNLHVQRGEVEATIRLISSQIKSFEQLGLPVQQLQTLCKQKSGLVLVAGRSGSGKTTTLASMIDFINRTQESVIVTIEDPVEYVHKSQKSIVKQRELGSDTHSFASALRNVLRQDPDVVVIGEILDGDTVLEAISAAETGHLVFGTLHAHGVMQALERLINLFPVETGPLITKKLSSCVRGILSQVLIPSQKGGMVLATEYLYSTPGVRATIREGRLEHLATAIQTGKDLGMHTMQSSLRDLELRGLITYEQAETYLGTVS